MINFLKVIRFHNLFILMMVMTVLGYRINAEGGVVHIKYALSFAVASFLVAACGYFNNNYLDQKVDQYNLKSIGFKFRPFHHLITLLICSIAFILLYIIMDLGMALWYVLFPVVLLLSYNILFKKIILIGNLIIAFLSIYQLMGFINCFELIEIGQDQFQYFYVVWMLINAFAVTLIREIIKDSEDAYGDKMAGYKTLPVLFPGSSYLFIVIISLFYVVFALLSLFVFLKIYWIPGMLSIAILGLLIMGIRSCLLNASYKKASLYLKLAMVIGVVLGFTY